MVFWSRSPRRLCGGRHRPFRGKPSLFLQAGQPPLGRCPACPRSGLRRGRTRPPGDLACHISRSAERCCAAPEAQRAPPTEGWRAGQAPQGARPRGLARCLESTQTQGGRYTPPFPGRSAALAPSREPAPRPARQVPGRKSSVTSPARGRHCRSDETFMLSACGSIPTRTYDVVYSMILRGMSA